MRAQDERRGHRDHTEGQDSSPAGQFHASHRNTGGGPGGSAHPNAEVSRRAAHRCSQFFLGGRPGGGVHSQEPVDRAHTRARRPKRPDRDDYTGDQSPVAFVHQGQPGVEHRQDQQRVAELCRPVFEPAHRVHNPDVHHRRAHDPGEKTERLEEAVQRGETADDCQRAGHLTRPCVERTDVDASLRHGATSVEWVQKDTALPGEALSGEALPATQYPTTQYPTTPYSATLYPITYHPSLYAAPAAWHIGAPL